MPNSDLADAVNDKFDTDRENTCMSDSYVSSHRCCEMLIEFTDVDVISCMGEEAVVNLK